MNARLPRSIRPGSRIRLLSLVLVLSACTTPRSNSQTLEKERMDVFVAYATPNDPAANALGAGSMLIGGLQKLVAKWIGAQAAQFSATSTGAVDFKLESSGSGAAATFLAEPLTIVVVRSVEARRIDPKGERALDPELRGLPLIDADTGTRLAEGVKAVLPSLRDKAFTAWWSQVTPTSPKPRVVTFIAVLDIRRELDVAARLRLLAYSYPALRARNLAQGVPFTDWSKTESVFALSLRGPDGVPIYPNGRYRVTGEFPVKWDRAAALDSSGADDDEVCELAVPDVYTLHQVPADEQAWQRPWTMPVLPLVTVRATLSESSDFEQALNGLADAVKEFEP